MVENVKICRNKWWAGGCLGWSWRHKSIFGGGGGWQEGGNVRDLCLTWWFGRGGCDCGRGLLEWVVIRYNLEVGVIIRCTVFWEWLLMVEFLLQDMLHSIIFDQVKCSTG